MHVDVVHHALEVAGQLLALRMRFAHGDSPLRQAVAMLYWTKVPVAAPWPLDLGKYTSRAPALEHRVSRPWRRRPGMEGAGS